MMKIPWIYNLNSQKYILKTNMKYLSLSLSQHFQTNAVHIKVYRWNVNKSFNYFGMPKLCNFSALGNRTFTRIRIHTHTLNFILWLRKIVGIVMGNFTHDFRLVDFFFLWIVGSLTFLKLWPVQKYLLRFFLSSSMLFIFIVRLFHGTFKWDHPVYNLFYSAHLIIFFFRFSMYVWQNTFNAMHIFVYLFVGMSV